nr:putative ribonuclease H-like domain-containing protein [Tanacetum cinerariifolium]
EAILKTFGGNEATKKTKNNQLKQQYGNFKAEGSKTLEQTFNRLQAIVLTNQKWNVSIATKWAILLESAEHLEVKTKSYKANKEENHALVADDEVLTEFDLMAKSSSSSENEVKKEKESLDNKLIGFEYALKDLDNLLGSQISYKNKEGLGYNAVPPPAQVYSPSKKDLSWTGLPEFVDDTVTDYSRPTPSIDALKCNISDLQSNNFSVSEHGESSGSIMSKPMIKFVKATDCPRVIKTNIKNARKSTIKYDEMYRNISKSPKVRGKSAVRTQPRVPRVSNVTKKISTVDSKFPTAKSTFTADLGNKGKAVKGNSQNNIDNKGYWDSGCSWYMIGNISYLSEYEPYDGGYVSFGHGGGKITSKCIIKTGKVEFENVHFVKELKYNLFSVSQIYDNKNSILFTDFECIVLGKDFKLKDDTNVLLRSPRQHNMYSIDLNNIVPHKNLTCLVIKASIDESMLWHRRLGQLNFKTMNKLVRNNLVKGLPSKCFENDHTCVACLKEKQHKAFCKTKLVNYVSKPLHTFHMDLFGPTSVSSLNHKWYCLVMTNDFSRFTWTFFIRTKDETSSILRNFITKIENLKDPKVKIIRCDNGGEFKNKEMNEFCTKKGIRREFNNARTPQQNGVAERRNRTLIEATRTMLADAKLPVTFWAEAVNIACYVQNKVLVNKSQNKTPYELFNSRIPAIGFLRPFGCHVMILNTLDHLGKFDAKWDEGYFVRYSLFSKAFRVFNKRTKKVEENLHVNFLKNKLIKKGVGPNWLFSIDTVTNYMNYVPVVVAGTSSTNISGTKDVASQAVKTNVSSLRYITLPNWFHEAHMETRNSDAPDGCNADDPKNSRISNPTATSKVPSAEQVEPAVSLTVETEIPTVSSLVPTVCLDISLESSSDPRLISKGDFSQKETPSLDNALTLTNRFEDTFGMEADLSNMETSIPASPTPTFRIHKDHPKSQIIGPVDTPVQTRHKSKEMKEQSFIATVHQKTNLDLL